MQTERFTRNRVESSTNSRDFESREDPRGDPRATERKKQQKPYESDNNFREMLNNNNNMTSPGSMVSNSNHRRDVGGQFE